MLSEKEMLLRRLSSAQFAAWEMHIYLDTHPNDRSALMSMQKYEDKARALRKEYERRFGPIRPFDMYGDARFEWVKDPWQWDVECPLSLGEVMD